jgi:hypothetical protein
MQANGLSDRLVGDFRPVLGLLDLLQVSRYDVHHSTLVRLRQELLAQLELPGITDETLIKLLQHCFPFIVFADLQQPVLAVMKKCTAIPAAYLQRLAASQELYDLCPVEVKRQIWLADEEVFRRDVFPILEDLSADNNPRDPLYELLRDDTTPPPAMRRRLSAPLQRIAALIGDSLELHNQLCQIARVLFVNTKNDRFCALRADVLMLAHDLQRASIYEREPCHALTWYACHSIVGHVRHVGMQVC